MKPMLDAPEAPASAARARKKRTRVTIPRQDVLHTISTSLTQNVIDMMTAEAAAESSTPAHIMRRIIIKHYKPLLRG